MAVRLIVYIAFSALSAVLLYFLLNVSFYENPIANYKQGRIWGKSESKETAVVPFNIEIPDSVLQDLNDRLSKWRQPNPTFSGVDYTYGMSSQVLGDIVNYWQKGYSWKKEEEKLNSLPQFKTIIQGLNVHFVHVKGSSTAKVRVPLLLVHGWPGSIVEFYKVIPLLTEADKNGIAFDIVAPSIPGYGFSEAASKPGFSAIAAAEVMANLMFRLGYDKFVYQGGDWGGIIGNILSHMYPENVIGYHTNFPLPPGANAMDLLHFFSAMTMPSFVVGKDEAWKVSFSKIKWMLEESGYFHEQATKPDTVGLSLSDSPVGLAGYILEKFGTWGQHAQFKSGRGLTNDELLTNIMVYWVTNNITPSLRFYKETVQSNYKAWISRSFVLVPTAVACYPGEMLCVPRTLIKRYMPRLVQYTDMPRGGHFAAFEEPQLFTEDLRKATVAFLKTRAEEEKWGTGLGLGI